MTKINTNKTKLIQFKTTKTTDLQLNITCNNDKIDKINNTNFLGIILDEQCNWKLQIDAVCNKVNRFIFALKKLRSVSSQDAAMLVYHSYVCSALRYGIVLWGNSVDAHRAFIAQKKSIRAVWGLKWMDSCKPIFQKQKLLTLPCIYIFEMSKFVKKHMELFEMNTNINKRTMTHKTLAVPRTRLVQVERNCYHMAITIFNCLPENFVSLPYGLFCSRLYKWLAEECFYSVKEFLAYKTNIKNKVKFNIV